MCWTHGYLSNGSVDIVKISDWDLFHFILQNCLRLGIASKSKEKNSTRNEQHMRHTYQGSNGQKRKPIDRRDNNGYDEVEKVWIKFIYIFMSPNGFSSWFRQRIKYSENQTSVLIILVAHCQMRHCPSDFSNILNEENNKIL